MDNEHHGLGGRYPPIDEDGIEPEWITDARRPVDARDELPALGVRQAGEGDLNQRWHITPAHAALIREGLWHAPGINAAPAHVLLADDAEHLWFDRRASGLQRGV